MSNIQDYEIDAYLGDFAQETTEEQKGELKEALALVESRFPDEDADDDRRDAGNAATQIILRDSTVKEIVDEWFTLRRRERSAWAGAVGAIVALNVQGVSENQIAQETGISRDTVRKALGKRRAR